MSTKTNTLVEQAVEALRNLPEDEQAVAAQDIIAITDEGVLPPTRSPEDQAIIAERMSKPRTYVSHDEIMALLRKYNPAL